MAFMQNFAAQTQRSLGGNSGINQVTINIPGMDARGSDSVALEELWRTHAKQILRVTQRITKNREDAEDALQDSFLRAYVHLHSFDRRSSIVTWLTRIAINSALMILRKRTSAPQLLSIDQGADSGADFRDLEPADQALSPEEQYAQLERQSIVRQALGTLRPSIRRALKLQTEERSIKEVGEMMGLSVSATKSRIFRANAALRKSLEQKAGRSTGRTKRLQLSPA